MLYGEYLGLHLESHGRLAPHLWKKSALGLKTGEVGKQHWLSNSWGGLGANLKPPNGSCHVPAFFIINSGRHMLWRSSGVIPNFPAICKGERIKSQATQMLYVCCSDGLCWFPGQPYKVLWKEGGQKEDGKLA